MNGANEISIADIEGKDKGKFTEKETAYLTGKVWYLIIKRSMQKRR